jgi:hypothetical protein
MVSEFRSFAGLGLRAKNSSCDFFFFVLEIESPYTSLFVICVFAFVFISAFLNIF